MTLVRETGETVSRATNAGGGIAAGLFAATLLMILFRQCYPCWWFGFARVPIGAIAVFAIIITWFAILFTDRYPGALFDYVVGVGEWGLGVQAYMSLPVADRCPPFSLR